MTPENEAKKTYLKRYRKDIVELEQCKQEVIQLRLKALPGGMMSEEELLYSIRTGSYKEFNRQWDTFRKDYVAVFGKATDMCLNRIYNSIKI